ncbi:hypothetical protein SAMN05444484_10688 [Flavobacterium chilense]|uniref:Uncharacterized protein n=1 Tax=Flavobacterium chilense TaxID=946677 RepID=A0A1M7IXJ8_9FLAO|nr:hypothetical protein SAMN05444484_10688 [Flavobacterium chilense]
MSWVFLSELYTEKLNNSTYNFAAKNTLTKYF